MERFRDDVTGQHIRVTKTQLEQLAARLSARDLAILAFVSRHRYATSAHLRQLFFASHATPSAAARATIRVLDRLLHHRLLGRLERRIGGFGSGSASSIWHPAAVGERLTRTDPAAPPRRYTDVSTSFLAHSLAVTDTHVELAIAARAAVVELSRVEVETEAWRTYLTPAGVSTILQPDLAVTVSTPEFDDHFYLEVDRGSESLPVVLTKCRAYDAYRRTGRAQVEHGVFPRVIWIVPTQRRAARLTAAIAAEPLLPDRVFTAITPDQLTRTVIDVPEGPISEPAHTERGTL